MHLLYCDESGSAPDPNQNHFVLSGISLFERQVFWLSNELDRIAERFDPAEIPDVELHGSPMMGGRGIWQPFTKADRIKAIEDALHALAKSHPSNRIFACVVNKAKVSPFDPVEIAFEQVSSRFDHYLARLHKNGDPQRGIIIFDKSTYETALQGLTTNFRTLGHRWGLLRNLSEVPLFLNSKASRLIQLADLVSYAIFRHYERGDDQFFKIIADRFDQEAGVRHGLCERL
ncbi:hypothetical protein DYBT9623_02079 [Dyadobacter sp. CECT 9623]|uniref:DUF3800 domain-containing protein n=1 Tax=Dyadobacter linearis TaxID=2823330 RepID=A0ABN7R5U1_9BACT|nr:DUF3800 domain-containing protein [Dyadobacter sp. CECT 9623]CAG5069343.1 hypothetical protein DYBT9623_02079 [Dyadobacter sp. CECT 9623]